jgi:DsbC/DsbD-like thiol-disulfide interchange protein
VLAGLEIQLDEGWKTYWRNPGSSGVPPRIETEGSVNLAKAELLFPAPRRFSDRDGDTIGYKTAVVFPVVLTPIDPSRPIGLKVAAEVGICREVCIPVQPTFSLTLPADASARPQGQLLSASLDRVPIADANGPYVPTLEQVTTTLDGAKPRMVIDAVFPGDSAKGDAFLEASDGVWIPLPQAAGQAASGARRFLVDLTDGVDLGDLAGRELRLTLVGSAGQMETTIVVSKAR